MRDRLDFHPRVQCEHRPKMVYGVFEKMPRSVSRVQWCKKDGPGAMKSNFHAGAEFVVAAFM